MNVLGYSKPEETTFRVFQRSTVWSVTRNDAFYGEYLSRGEAVAGAKAAALAVEGLGGVARVLLDPGAKPIAPGRRATKR